MERNSVQIVQEFFQVWFDKYEQLENVSFEIHPTLNRDNIYLKNQKINDGGETYDGYTISAYHTYKSVISELDHIDKHIKTDESKEPELYKESHNTIDSIKNQLENILLNHCQEYFFLNEIFPKINGRYSTDVIPGLQEAILREIKSRYGNSDTIPVSFEFIQFDVYQGVSDKVYVKSVCAEFFDETLQQED